MTITDMILNQYVNLLQLIAYIKRKKQSPATTGRVWKVRAFNLSGAGMTGIPGATGNYYGKVKMYLYNEIAIISSEESIYIAISKEHLQDIAHDTSYIRNPRCSAYLIE